MDLHDATPAFVEFYEGTLGKSNEEKLERFWSELHPDKPRLLRPKAVEVGS